ncbi:tRNA (guanine-N1)-methyltransferase [uncultured Croceitalea sp.]|uniref:tRNA (guanine-N1)-methyltransferase n=1 Tax=uncultured Croceitalea sp. TaxID=1798908 RepID=UPI00330622A1
MKKIMIFLGGLFIMINPLKAQEQTADKKEDASINGQFETIIRKSTNYRQAGKRYEVVRLLELEALRKNILDSVSTSNTNIAALRATIAENETSISSLNTKLDETTKNLNQLTEEKDSMSFFGAMVSKGTYKLIVWSIIFGLLAFLLFFIYRFKNSNFLTQQAKSALSDVEAEFEQHRRRSLEREQKISRELQDEINKNKKGT